jgi:GT2 family glycosyltransferase
MEAEAEVTAAAAPDLTVCIVSWNTCADLRQCLASVFACEGEVAFEVIVVDNASTDGSPDMVRREFPAAQLIANPVNLGYAVANNQALRLARGRYRLLLNSDTVVHGGALAAMVRFMDARPDAAAVGPRILNPDQTLQYSCRRFPRLATGLFRKVPLGRLIPDNRWNREYLMSDWRHDAVREVDWISGAAMCLRPQALEQVGLLDEGYYMYCEDLDWCYRARQAGWKIYYLPQAVVTHAIGRSSDQRPLRMVAEFHRSMLRFYRKHYAAHVPLLLRPFVPVGIVMRAVLVLLENVYNAARNVGYYISRGRPRIPA